MAKSKDSLIKISYGILTIKEANLVMLKMLSLLFVLSLSVAQQVINSNSLQIVKDNLERVRYTIDFDSAKFYFKELRRKAKITNSSHFLFYANKYYADAHEHHGSPDSTLYYYNLCFKYTNGEDSLSLRAFLHHDIAYTLRSQGKLVESAAAEIRAAEYAEQSGNYNFRNAIYNGLATIYEQLQDQERAEAYFIKAIDAAKNQGRAKSLMLALRYYGAFQARYGKYQNALDKLEQSYAMAIALDDEISLAYSQLEIAKCFWGLGKKKDAIKKAESASIIWSKHGQVNEIRSSNVLLGKYYLEQNQLRNAEKYLNLALRSNINVNLIDRLDLYESLSKLFIKKKEFKLAFSYLKKTDLLKDSITHTKTFAQIAKLNYKYEAEVKDRKIAEQQLAITEEKQNQSILWAVLIFFALSAVTFSYILNLKQNTNTKLQRHNDEIEEKNAIIEASLEEKETLLKEIHHRVKNNLQVISSLLNLQSDSVEDPNAVQAILEGRNRVKSIALLHQLLYQSDQLSKIGFKEYTSQLVSFLRSVYKTEELLVEFELNIDDVSLDIDTAVPIGIILNELVTNAYKYAFKNRSTGMVIIDITDEGNGHYQLQVTDNGVGLPKELDPSTAESLGLKLVSLLTRQLKGNFSYFNSNGAQFHISFTDTNRRKQTA